VPPLTTPVMAIVVMIVLSAAIVWIPPLFLRKKHQRDVENEQPSPK
jgi:hypothetical protein